MNRRKTAYVNGKIYTVNDKQKWAECLLTDGNKISFVGSKDKAKSKIDNQTEVINLEGALMLPGFIDSHAHTIIGGLNLMSVDLSIAQSIDDFKSTLKKYVAENENKWIEGGNWNHQNWENAELPKKEWVDSFSEDTPVFVSRMDLHMALANSCTLKLAGITKDTPDPAGGKIERDPVTGEPTGILKDRAMDLVFKVIPKPTDDELYKAGLLAMKEAKRFGVTSIQDITMPDDLRILQMLEKKSDLTCRIYARMPIENCEMFFDKMKRNEMSSEKISIRSMKAFMDGSLGSSTAFFLEPYEDDKNNYGLPMDYVIDGRLEQWALACDKNNLQLSIHAIGDRAISDLLDIFEKIERTNPKQDRRFRIEHAQHIRERDLLRCADMNVIASMQPYHLFDDGGWAHKKIGKDRLHQFFVFNSFPKNNVKMCFGSDWCVATLDPLKGIYAAVTRHTSDGKYPVGLIPNEKISVEDAVKCYTINAAYAAFEEEIKGSIEIGKLADLVVLSDNIFEIAPEAIKETKVIKTIFDGKEI